MAVVSEFDARIEMKGFIDRSRAHYADWYVGVAADAERKLTEEHGVQESDWWIVRRLATAEAARRVAAHFHDLGCEGAAGEGEAAYAYWKRGHTRP